MVDFIVSRHAEEQMLVRAILGRTMKVSYDPGVDVLRILFNASAVFESDEDKPGVIVDYDAEGRVVGMEILDASKRVDNPRSVELAIAA